MICPPTLPPGPDIGTAPTGNSISSLESRVVGSWRSADCCRGSRQLGALCGRCCATLELVQSAVSGHSPGKRRPSPTVPRQPRRFTEPAVRSHCGMTSRAIDSCADDAAVHSTPNDSYALRSRNEASVRDARKKTAGTPSFGLSRQRARWADHGCSLPSRLQPRPNHLHRESRSGLRPLRGNVQLGHRRPCLHFLRCTRCVPDGSELPVLECVRSHRLCPKRRIQARLIIEWSS